MIPISLSDIDDADTDIWYRWYRYLISMIPILDIDDTDTDIWYQWYRYQYLISMIPIPIADINDTDIWYRWYRYRYRHLISMIPIPTAITMRYRWDTNRAKREVNIFRLPSRASRQSQLFLDYFREPPGRPPPSKHVSGPIGALSEIHSLHLPETSLMESLVTYLLIPSRTL